MRSGTPTYIIINHEGIIMEVILGGGFVELKSNRRMLTPSIERTAKLQKA